MDAERGCHQPGDNRPPTVEGVGQGVDGAAADPPTPGHEGCCIGLRELDLEDRPAPDVSVSGSSKDFEEWVGARLRQAPAYAEYPEVLERAICALCGWRARFTGRRDVWCRIMKGERCLKELNECAPVVDRVIDAVARMELTGGQKATILDLCSGFGYMSMLLSEVLPADRVDRIVLVDKAWPTFDSKESRDYHINWEHVYEPGWPILLTTSKRDIKRSSGLRDMDKHLFHGHAEGSPVIVVGVHLCSTLAIRAVEVFNTQPTAACLMLKPCCLPPHYPFVRDEKVWQLGSHSFAAKEVCAHGSWNKAKWKGQNRGKLAARFETWVRHLYAGVEPDEGVECRKRLDNITVQKTHFQNAFVFGERCRYFGKGAEDLPQESKGPAEAPSA